MMQRRSLILSALAAPFVARVPGLLMPVKPVLRPEPATALLQYSWGDGRWHDLGLVPAGSGRITISAPRGGVYTLRLSHGA